MGDAATSADSGLAVRGNEMPGSPGHVTPPGTGVFGMWLFLGSLAILFVASMLGYVIVRLQLADRGLAELGVLRGGSDAATGGIPPGLFVSTVVILLSSVTASLALGAFKRENIARGRSMLAATLSLAVLFVAVQAPSLWQLLERNEAMVAATTVDDNATPAVRLYALLFFLVLVHALHVIGGVLPLAWITWRAHTRGYDHEHHEPVKLITMYWHFLDGVWLVMFGLIMAMG